MSINPLEKSCDVCFLFGCRHEKDWGHPCDQDENGVYQCELREKMAHLTKYAPDVAPVTSAEHLSSSESVPAVESDTQPRG